MKRIKSSCLVVGIVISVACGLILAMFLYLSDKEERRDCGRASSGFVKALVQNDAKTAKRLTTPEVWGQIDEWMNKHEPFHCPFSFDLENETLSGAGGTWSPENNNITYSPWHWSYTCANETGYFLSVDEVFLQFVQDECKVIRWSEPCEAKGWNNFDRCW
jgi:hypothetical protein